MIKLGFAHIFSNDQKTDPMINVLKGTRFQLTEYFFNYWPDFSVQNNNVKRYQTLPHNVLQAHLLALPKKKNIIKILVDFKSEYNKTKISEMDISNIYLKKQKF